MLILTGWVRLHLLDLFSVMVLFSFIISLWEGTLDSVNIWFSHSFSHSGFSILFLELIFIFGLHWVSVAVWAFSGCREWGDTLVGVRAAHFGGFSRCWAQALGHTVVAPGWVALWPRWNLSGPGTELVSRIGRWILVSVSPRKSDFSIPWCSWPVWITQVAAKMMVFPVIPSRPQRLFCKEDLSFTPFPECHYGLMDAFLSHFYNLLPLLFFKYAKIFLSCF